MMYGINHKKRRIEDDFSKYFEKKISFTPENDWILPSNVYQTEKWQVESLQMKKVELNAVKELLENYDLSKWSKYTKLRDPSTAVLNKLRYEYNLEFQTQAWCKFYEILSNFPKLIENDSDSNLISLHLCEAPGAFVCSLNHYLTVNHPIIKWQWYANALNPYYEGNSENEMIADDRFIKLTLDNWIFGHDNTGDITNYQNHLTITNRDDLIMLITADGSIDCMADPGNQENHVSYLHYCETMTALKLLNFGGNYVMKMFTMFEQSTINLLYLLNCVFETVNVYKPLTSKSGNSELYLICLNYKKSLIENFDNYLRPYMDKCEFNEKSMFNLEDLPKSFMKQLEQCADYFMKLQIEKIKDNIENYDNEDEPGKNNRKRKRKNYSCLRKFNNSIAHEFIRRYFIKDIPLEQWIMQKFNKKNVDVDIPNKTLSITFGKLFRKNDYSIRLDLRSGKKLSKISNSKFTTNYNLKNFHFKRNSAKLYELSMFQLQRSNYGVVNLTMNIIEGDIHKFQLNFIVEVMNAIKSNDTKDLIVIGPFITNIHAGLIYLLCISYEYCIFLNSGSVLLKNLNHFHKDNLLKQLETIINEFNLRSNQDEIDLLEIINFNDLFRTNICDLIVKHNGNFAKYWHLN